MKEREKLILRNRLIPVPTSYSFDLDKEYILADGSKMEILLEETNGAEALAGKLFQGYWGKTPVLTVKETAYNSKSEDAYTLSVKEDLITVKGKNLTSLKNAFKTLRQLAEVARGTFRVTDYIVSCCEIEDAPVMSFRGIHFCIFPETTREDLEKRIRLAAAHKFNYAVIEPWGIFPYETHPFLSWKGMTWKKEEIKRLVHLGKELGITLCPQLNILGHAACARGGQGKHVILDQDPTFQSLFEPDGWTWCLSNPYTRQVLSDAVVELCEAFENPPYFHIGCDEAINLAVCRDCRKSNLEDLLLDHIIHFKDLLQSRGARTIMWHDMLLTHGDKRFNGYYANRKKEDHYENLCQRLPRDIIIADWQYGCPPEPGEVPEVDSSWPTNAYFKEEGFDVVLSPWKNNKGTIQQGNCIRERNLMGMLETTWHTLLSYPDYHAMFYVASNCAWNANEENILSYNMNLTFHLRQVIHDMGLTRYEDFGFDAKQL